MSIIRKIRQSMQYKLVALFLVIIAVTIMSISLFAFYRSSETMEKNLGDYTFQIVSQVNRNIEFYIEEMENIAAMCNYNYNVQKYLKNYKPANDLERFKDANKITELLNNITSVRDDIISVMIFGNNGYVLKNNTNLRMVKGFDITKYDWYINANKNFGQSVVSSPHTQDYLENSNKSVVSLSRVITNYDAPESVGVILIDLNLNVIKNISSKIKLGEEGYVYIIDKKGNPVYHPHHISFDEILKPEYTEDIINRENGTFIKEIDWKKRLVTFTTSKYTGWKIVGIAPVEEMITGSRELRDSIVLIGLISLIILFSAAVFVSGRITRRVNLLDKNMEKAMGGDLDTRAYISGEDEISRLGNKFNMMIKRVNDLMKQIVGEQESKRKLEVKALQNQINPHFLYNTLDSIVWMAEGNKNEEVISMVTALSKLFRISLSKGMEIIPVSDEIEHVKSYLTIQKMRYKSKLDYIFDIDPEVYRYSCIKLILQPIVENSIYHGIKNKREKGTIWIEGRIEDECLLFKVIDNGIGILKEKIKEIMEDARNKNHSGIGFHNVNERIQLYFGKRYGLKILSEPGEFTCVEIRLPLINQTEGMKDDEER